MFIAILCRHIPATSFNELCSFSDVAGMARDVFISCWASYSLWWRSELVTVFAYQILYIL
jgi:hypothetical protein